MRGLNSSRRNKHQRWLSDAKRLAVAFDWYSPEELAEQARDDKAAKRARARRWKVGAP